MVISGDIDAVSSRFNEMYGHAAILRNYLGIDDNRLKVVGQLQHGWTIRSGVYFNPPPFYLWNERSAEGPYAEHESRTFKIGAPYLYLPPPPDVVTIGRVPLSLLALPQHTTSGHQFDDPYKEWYVYGKWLAKGRDEAGLSQVTACLHENDYNDFGVISALSRSGIVVATAGDARVMSTTFLDRMRALSIQHGMATSNAIGSALLYAAYEGMPVFIDGPPPELVPKCDTGEWLNSEVWDPEWLDSEFPGWRCDWRHAEPHREDAMRELGFAYKKSRADLWDILQLAVML